MEPPSEHGSLTLEDNDVRKRKSAVPSGTGNVVMFITLKRKRVISFAVMLVKARLIVMVPNDELFAASGVKSLTRFGVSVAAMHGASKLTTKVSLVVLGSVKLSGDGAPRRCPAEVGVAVVSTNTKSLALSLVSFGMPPCCMSRKNVWSKPVTLRAG